MNKYIHAVVMFVPGVIYGLYSIAKYGERGFIGHWQLFQTTVEMAMFPMILSDQTRLYPWMRIYLTQKGYDSVTNKS